VRGLANHTPGHYGETRAAPRISWLIVALDNSKASEGLLLICITKSCP
jgi:hypothetical protein